MNTEMILVDALVVLFTVLPCFYLYKAGMKRINKLTFKFDQEVKNHGLEIVEKDAWNYNQTGLDVKQKKLLLVQYIEAILNVEIIDLNRVQRSTLLQEYKAIKVNGEMEDILQRVDLELTLTNAAEKKIITLFDADKTYFQDFEMLHASRWNDLINTNAAGNPVFRKTA